MPSARRRTVAAAALTMATLAAAGCGGGGSSAAGSRPTRDAAAAAHRLLPERIVHAPRGLMAAAEPTAHGALWTLAGKKSAGVFKIDPANGSVTKSFSVSAAARSLAASPHGTLAVALDTKKAGALQLLSSRHGKVIKTVPLPAPARDVTIGGHGTTFYVLSGWRTSASVTGVRARGGHMTGSIAVPADTVSIAVDDQQSVLYALERTGVVSQFALRDGKFGSSFRIGRERGRSLALSPDGRTLYVLKGSSTVANIAVVGTATQSVHRVLPAPSHCHQVLVSADGKRLYEIAGTARYGNIQIFAV